MERVKMPRSKRASQFSPFDALKGLHEALRLKEYQHLCVEKGEISEEDAEKISKVLLSLEKDDVVCVNFYDENDQHYHQVQGRVRTNFSEGFLEVLNEKGKTKVQICNIKEIEIVK